MFRHPFHLVEKSPWPLMSATSAFTLTIGLALWFHKNHIACMCAGLILILICMLVWWRDVIREATFMGYHTSNVMKGMQIGMLLFITSEIMFFFAFFWAYFHSSLAPTPELGCMWPPKGVIPMNPFATPLLNTAILLSSGATVTLTHHMMMSADKNNSMISLMTTLLLGMIFTLLQLDEYKNASFNISDSVYGATFFVATGFHGLHVLIGTTFLTICLLRLYSNHFSTSHHFGFEAAAWYWHFVDVVWILLYICIYWWGA